MPFKATRLMADSLTLKRAKIDIMKLNADEVRQGAGILRRLIIANDDGDGERGPLVKEWRDFRASKGV
jgi:hypothetical protein